MMTYRVSLPMPRARRRPLSSALTGLLVALAIGPLLPTVTRAQSVPQQAHKVTVDRVVAVINDSIILQSELNRRVAPLAFDLNRITDERERQRRIAKLRSQQLDQMIDEELIVQAAEAANLSVSAKQVQAAFDEIKNQNGFDDARLADELRKQGYSVSAYRQDVRRQLLRLTAVNQLVRPRVSVTDEDVRARYDELGRRSGQISKVHLQHILLGLPPHPTSAQLEATKRRASEIVAMANNGTSFADLAKTYSDDPGTKNSGGDLGWIERGSLDTEWEAIVFSMDKGEVRGPVNGPNGLHVFRVADLEQSEQKSYDDSKAEIRSELFRHEMDRQTRMWLEELRKKAHIDIKL